MRKLVAIMLSFMLVFNLAGTTIANAEETINDLVDENFDFDSLDDPAFLQYLEDSVYANLESEFAGSEAVYQIDDISVTFISREYLEETAYNSKANIFFGYTLAQIDEVFQGEKYVFTLSDKGETVVQEFLEFPDDTYNRIIKNVLIGTGVILICVTVTVATMGAASPAALAASTGVLSTTAKVNMIFAASASKAISFAASGAVFAGTTKLVTRGVETGWDLDVMTESAALSASEGFKWGAISGAIIGGSQEALTIHHASRGPITPTEAEQAALDYYGGSEQITYYEGHIAEYGTPNAVRPDVVVGNEAIEVKRYDLVHCMERLKDTLYKQVSKRNIHLPEGMTQRIVLNVEGRGYTTQFVQEKVYELQRHLWSIYPDIPIDVMGGTL